MYTYHSVYPMKKYWAEAWRTRPYNYFILVCFSTGQLDWNINTFFMNFPGSLPSQSNLSTLFVSHCQRAVMHTISVYQFTYTQTFTYYIYKNIPSLLNGLFMHEYQDKKILANLSRSLIHNQKHQTKGTDFIWVIDLILILFQNAPFNSPIDWNLFRTKIETATCLITLVQVATARQTIHFPNAWLMINNIKNLHLWVSKKTTYS